jgi:hypothetical protein
MVPPSMVTELATVKLTVKYLNPPKDGKKAWTIKDTEGCYYFVRPEMKDVFDPGETYEIDYTESEFPKGSGRTNRWVDSARSANGEALTSARRPVPPPQSTLKAYAKQQNGGSNLDACVCGLMKSFIETGKVEMTAAAISKLRTICQAGWLNEMDDEIPYP